MRFNRTEIEKAADLLRLAMASGRTMGEALAGARNPHEDASLRMAFSLGLELQKRNKTVADVESVDYERVDKHRHAIEINWVGRRREGTLGDRRRG